MAAPNLFKLARNKLHLSVGKDNSSLYRWVLLKNSISSSTSTPTSPSVSQNEVDEYYVEEEEEEEESDSFMFPDVSTENAEAQWLDSLLADLADDDEDITLDSDVSVSVLPVDDDDNESLLSPLPSPQSSSDNLPNYYPPPTTVMPYPYPIPYPPFHPPLMNSYHFDSNNSDDFDDMSVPEAIEDTSDDESEGHLLTPSLTNSSISASSLDPASIPLPRERKPPRLHVHIDVDDFYPFDVDPLPFSTNHFDPYHTYQQDC